MCDVCNHADPDDQIVIEFPAAGATYGPAFGDDPEYGVYLYSEYPESSVNAGQQKRSNLGSYPDLKEAQKEHPRAEWAGQEGTGFTGQEPPASPPEWFDPAAAGEVWSEDDR